MKQAHCEFEEKIAAAARSGQWSDALRAHAESCGACGETALVSECLRVSAQAATQDARLPDAGLIWRRAEKRANAEAIERAMRPITWARRAAWAVCATAIAMGVATIWPRIAGFWKDLAESWSRRPAPASGHESFLLTATMAFLLALLPLLFAIYSAWSEE